MSERALPSVSAVIATRDRPALLRRAVSAVLAQDYDGPIECIVVSDSGEDIDLSDLGPPQPGRSLVSIRNTRTPGLAGARNSGTQAATGELLAFCDDDDEWWPDKIATQEAVMRRQAAAVVVTGVRIVYEDQVRDRVPPPVIRSEDLLHSRRTEVHPSSILVERRAFDAIGPVDEAIPGSYGEDYEWLVRAAAHGPIAGVSHPLVTVHWGGSMFADRWQTIVDAIDYLTTKHPVLLEDDANAARLYGRVAFAHAALRHRSEAARWAWRGIRRRPAERRPYLALAVASGCVSASTIQRRANRAGRGV